MVYEDKIYGTGVNLRPVEEDDAAFILELRGNKERTRFVHAVQGNETAQRAWIRKQREREGDYYFIAEDKQGKPFGAVGYYNLSGKNGELGRMVIDGSYIQNCEAIYLARKFAFEVIGADYVRCTVVEGNTPVIAQIKRFGGVQTGEYQDEEANFHVLVFRVAREAYEKKKGKVEALIQKAYKTLQVSN